jgi:hypothetical protein
VFRRKDGYVAVKSKDNKTYEFTQVAAAKRERDTSFNYGGQVTPAFNMTAQFAFLQ